MAVATLFSVSRVAVLAVVEAGGGGSPGPSPGPCAELVEAAALRTATCPLSA